MLARMLVAFCSFALLAQVPNKAHLVEDAALDKAADALRVRIDASPLLPFHAVPLAARPLGPGWQSGVVSSIAVGANGNIYEIQRGEQADPVLVMDRTGKVLHSWGKGNYTLPHSIRIDPAGNIWTVDAGSSTVIKYSPSGQKLLSVELGGQPRSDSPFNGATDIAFGPNGHLFITDGYGNARILEYTALGRKVKQWGKPGTGPGEFRLPHAIQINERGTIYVADRENGRIEKFDMDGTFLGEIPMLGRTYGLKLTAGILWASMGPFNKPPGSPGWLVKLDGRTGRILGHLDLPAIGAGHSVEQMPSGEPIITSGKELLWFQAN